MAVAEFIGQQTSPQLSKHLRASPNNKDRVDVALRNGISFSLLEKIVLRSATVTDNSSAALEQLCKLGIENLNKQATEGSRTVSELRKELENQ